MRIRGGERAGAGAGTQGLQQQDEYVVMRIPRIMTISRRRKRMRVFKDVEDDTNNDEGDASTVLLRSRLRRRRIMLRMMTQAGAAT